MLLRSYLSCSLFAVIILTAGPATIQAETTIKQLCADPFQEAELMSTEEFRQMVQKKWPELRLGFVKAGASQVFDEFVHQSSQSEIEAIEVNPGDRLLWMIAKQGGKVIVSRDLVMSGDKSVPAFRLKVDQGGTRYVFVMPQKCGNVSLVRISPVPAVRALAAEVRNEPPYCQSLVSSTKLRPGQEMLIDASQSNDPDGSLASVLIQIADPNRTVVAEKRLTQAPFVHRMSLADDGKYTVRVSVVDNRGLESSTPACADTEIVVTGVAGSFVADIGMLHQPGSATYLPLRYGYEYHLDERYGLLALVGLVPLLDGEEDDYDVLSVDLTAIRHFDRFYLSGGVGLWRSSGDEQADLILNLGYPLYRPPDGAILALFVEGRADFDQLDDLGSYGRIGIGLRYQF